MQESEGENRDSTLVDMNKLRGGGGTRGPEQDPFDIWEGGREVKTNKDGPAALSVDRYREVLELRKEA